jgi:hypothetical protein
MTAKKKLTRAEKRAARAKARLPIVAAIVALEKKYGESAVSGAFARHVQIRRERRNLEWVQEQTAAKIAKLNG